MQRDSRFKNSRGSVLVAVVWTLIILTMFTVFINRRVSQELLLGRWVREQVVTRLLAKAGVERALLEIQSDKFVAFDALNESWSSNEKAFKEISLQGGVFSMVCNPDVPLPDEKEKDQISGSGFLEKEGTLYGACDESARMNLNIADEFILKRLFQIIDPNLDDAKATGIAQSILDWRDSDDATLQFGAEATYYRFLRKPYEPRNGNLESVEELLMIKGITREIYEGVKNYVTVYTDGKINFNTASSLSLRTLGISQDLSKKIISYRRGEDGIWGSKDDRIFQVVDGISPALSTGMTFSGDEFKQITDAIGKGLVSVQSSAFRIQSIGRLIRGGQKIELRVVCVAKRNSDILYWKEGNS